MKFDYFIIQSYGKIQGKGVDKVGEFIIEGMI